MPDSRLPTSLRRALIEAMGGWGPYTVHEIDTLFQSHDFFDVSQGAEEQGVRRTRAAEYLDAIDWGAPRERRKLLDLTEDVLVHYPEGSEEPSGSPGRVLRNVLRRLGVESTESGALVMSAVSPPLASSEAETRTQPIADDDPYDIWPPDRIRVFLSHVSVHRERIATLAVELESSEFACFVAHEEIEPSLEWQRVIESALSSCDVLVAYVTPEWPQSKWCDQEVGWALARGIVVVTADAGESPYGFVARIQAIPARTETADRELARKIVKAIVVAVFARSGDAAVGHLVQRLARVVVDAFCVSPSQTVAARRFDLLRRIPREVWTDAWRSAVRNAVATNHAFVGARLRDGRDVTAAALAATDG